MSQEWRMQAQDLKWEHRYAAIFKCSPKEEELAEIIVAGSAEISANKNLQRVLKTLRGGLLSKREYPNAVNPTVRKLVFRRSSDVEANEGEELLNALLNSKSKREIHRYATELANRYMRIKGVQRGVLIFLVSQVELMNTAKESSVFVFKCDFEEISQLTPGQVFRRIEDAFGEQAKKGAQYPSFDGKKFNRSLVRVFDSLGETQYWLEFLNLSPRPSPLTDIHSATIEALEKTHPEIITKYGDAMKSLSGSRSLAGADRLIKTDDRLSVEEFKPFIDSLPDNLSEMKIPLSLDKSRVEVPFKEYGRTWIVAEQAGTRYILIKGAQLEVRTKMVTPFDLTDLLELREALAELDTHIT